MSQINLKDKSWGIIFLLCFILPPLGIFILVIKIAYTIYKNQASGQSFTTTATDFRRDVNPSYTRPIQTQDYTDELQDLEEDLVDVFHQWKENTNDDEPSPIKDQITEVTVLDADFVPEKAVMDDRHDVPEVTSEGLPGKAGIEDQEMTVDPYDYLSTDHLESDLNDSTEALRVHDGDEVMTEFDLTFTDVHIDTEITFDDGPEDHDHEGETPLKVIKCRMCDTENRIYIIDKFETPTCEKCGMLLLD